MSDDTTDAGREVSTEGLDFCAFMARFAEAAPTDAEGLRDGSETA